MYKLFEKFVSKSDKGTGKGLFISKSIVEAQGARYGEKIIRMERELRLPLPGL
jgi:nitrogen fixation/metabolism regulation signal transduction histidine kinase